MSKTPNPKTAFSSEKENQNSTLAEAWCAYFNNPETGCHALASALNARLLRLWPDGSGEGLIANYAPEIRQDTLLLTIARYLTNNPKLQLASKQKDYSPITREVERSLRGALKVVILRTRREIYRQPRHLSLQEVDEESLPSILHPAERKDFLALPTDARLAVVKATLHTAVAMKAVPRRAAELMGRMLSDGQSSSDVAKNRKTSRQAVHQALEPARRYLRRNMHRQEFSQSELLP